MSLFGGTQKVDILTGGQKTLLNSLSDILGAQLGKSGPVYGGQVTPGTNAIQQNAFDYAGGMLGQMPDTTGAINSMIAGQSANALDPQAYAQQAIIDPARLAYEDATRELEARYGGTWGQSGGYQDIMQENAARFGTGLSQTLADFARYNQDTSNAQRQAGIGASGQQSNTIANTLGTMLGVGAEQRAQQGQQNLEQYNRWNAEQAYNNPWLGLLGPTLGTQAYGIGQQQGILPQVAGGVTGIAGSLAQFMR